MKKYYGKQFFLTVVLKNNFRPKNDYVPFRIKTWNLSIQIDWNFDKK